jgi:chorismate synthase
VAVTAWVDRVGPHEVSPVVRDLPVAELRRLRDASPLAVPLLSCAELENAVNTLRSAQDSWGGAVRCRVEGLPVGLGEPIFDKLGAVLGHGLLSLPAAVSYEAGGGNEMSFLPGSAIRDAIAQTAEGPRPGSNRHGGLLGGMTTGLPLFVGVSFHAPTSIARPVSTVNVKGEEQEIVVGGRHDAFPLPRAVPMVEAMVAITLVDALLRAGRIAEKI